MSPTTDFAANLRAARARAKMNQSQLASICGYGQTNISKWDRGYSTPNVDQLLVIAAALGTTAADLVAGLAVTANHGNGTAPPLINPRPRRRPSVEA